jgi:hypothetical protein
MESGGGAMAKLKVGQEITVSKITKGWIQKDLALEIIEVDAVVACVTLAEPNGTQWAFSREDLKALVAMFKGIRGAERSKKAEARLQKASK